MNRNRDEILDSFPEGEELFADRREPQVGTITEPRQGVSYAIPARPSKAERTVRPERAKPRLGIRAKLVGLAAIAASATLAADRLGVIDIPIPDLNPSPGQEAGTFAMSDVVMSKFKASSSNATGNVTVSVASMTQQWVDKPEAGEKLNPHETMVLRNGKYQAVWGVQGLWQANKTQAGVEVLLPAVTALNLDTTKDPVVDESKSSRAAVQKLGGIFGGDTDDATPRKNARKALREWMSDPRKSGQYQTLLACTAIAGAADNAGSLLQAMDVAANVERYYPPRSEKPAVLENAPTISFRIPDPTKQKTTLGMSDCLDELDGIGYSSKLGASEQKSIIGMGSTTIGSLKLDPQVQ